MDSDSDSIEGIQKPQPKVEITKSEQLPQVSQEEPEGRENLDEIPLAEEKSQVEENSSVGEKSIKEDL